jgi:hypothetical protein
VQQRLQSYMMLLGSRGYGTDAYLSLADAMQVQSPPVLDVQ